MKCAGSSPLFTLFLFLSFLSSLSCLSLTPQPSIASSSSSPLLSSTMAMIRNPPYLWADASGATTSTPFTSSDSSSSSSSSSSRSSFSLVTYNILAPINGEGSKHSYAAVSTTKWTRRRDKLIEDMRRLQADVLCLQEVSSKALRETFIPQLRILGLECCAFAPAKVHSAQYI